MHAYVLLSFVVVVTTIIIFIIIFIVAVIIIIDYIMTDQYYDIPFSLTYATIPR